MTHTLGLSMYPENKEISWDKKCSCGQILEAKNSTNQNVHLEKGFIYKQSMEYEWCPNARSAKKSL
jgi:hypothetical protein